MSSSSLALSIEVWGGELSRGARMVKVSRQQGPLVSNVREHDRRPPCLAAHWPCQDKGWGWGVRVQCMKPCVFSRRAVGRGTKAGRCNAQMFQMHPYVACCVTGRLQVWVMPNLSGCNVREILLAGGERGPSTDFILQMQPVQSLCLRYKMQFFGMGYA
jgi:hypothetical protein